jgi:hypothetical protein
LAVTGIVILLAIFKPFATPQSASNPTPAPTAVAALPTDLPTEAPPTVAAGAPQGTTPQPVAADASGGMQFAEEVAEIEALQVSVQLGATKTTIEALGGDTPQAFEGEFVAEPGVDPLNVVYEENARLGAVTITQAVPALFVLGGDPMGTLHLGLTPAVPIDLTLTPGLGGAILDLTDLNIRSLRLSDTNGEVRVFLPRHSEMELSIERNFGAIVIEPLEDASGLILRSLTLKETFGPLTINLPVVSSYTVKIESQYVDADLIVPPDLAGRVEVASEYLMVEMLNARFAEVGERQWETAGFADAPNKVVISVSSTTGTLTILESAPAP